MFFSLVMEVICFSWSPCGSPFLFHFPKSSLTMYLRKTSVKLIQLIMSAKIIVFIALLPAKNTLHFYYFIISGTKQSVNLETEKERPCLCPERPKPAAEQGEEITKPLIISIMRKKKKDL